MSSKEVPPHLVRAWHDTPPDRLIGRGHPAGDFLEAYRWTVLERELGFLRVEAQLPSHVQNPRGQLFGGFTPTYVDLISLLATREGVSRETPWRWLATTDMHVRYFAPVEGPRFVMEAHVVHRSDRASTVESRFLDTDGSLLVLALTSMLELR